MFMFKKIFTTFLICLFAFSSYGAIQLPLVESFEDAKKQSKEEKKLLVLHFTGTTWCPPCKFLDGKILHTKEFAKFAKENLVIVEMDFARNGKPSNEKFADEYKKLAEEFSIRSFPTMIFINPQNDKQEIMKGVAAKDVKSFIKYIKDIRKRLDK